MISTTTAVIDFGSWIGPTALFAANFAKHVVALEPDPIVYTILERNIELNPRLKNIESINKCISNKDELVVMDSKPAGCSTVTNVSENSRGIRTECTTLLTLINSLNLKPPLFIKVDVEGFESQIVPTWYTWIPELKPTLFLSMHQFLREFSAEEKNGFVQVLNLFPFVAQTSDVNKSDIFDITDWEYFVQDNLKLVRPNVSNLCIRCDYLCSFENLNAKLFIEHL